MRGLKWTWIAGLFAVYGVGPIWAPTNKPSWAPSWIFCGYVCHELPGEANRTSKRKRGDMRNKEYMEAIKEQTQNR